MSFDCNNGVCYIRTGSAFGSGVSGVFPMPMKDVTWTVYGKESCPFCHKLREFFDSTGIKYTYYDIQKIPQGSEVIDKLSGLTGGYDKVPMVFFYGMFIGGYTETLKYLGIGSSSDDTF